MKAYNVDVESFAKMINECKGKVTIITEDGDRLVTNSFLSGMIGFATVLKVASMKEIEFECDYPEDKIKVIQFLMQYRGPEKE